MLIADNLRMLKSFPEPLQGSKSKNNNS